MGINFIPSTDAGLLAWVQNFSSLITANPTSYGLTAPTATALASLVTAYSTALTAATDPSTRGGSTILAKGQARVNLVAYCRKVARCIQGTLTVTDQQRYDLGLTVRNVEPTPIPRPAGAPLVEVKQVFGRTARVRLIDAANPTRRGRPAGTMGASVFSHVGPTPPADLSAWQFEGSTGRTTIDVTFPSSVPAGATVWLTAFWFNPRKESGPPCDPVSANLPGGSVSNAA